MFKLVRGFVSTGLKSQRSLLWFLSILEFSSTSNWLLPKGSLCICIFKISSISQLRLIFTKLTVLSLLQHLGIARQSIVYVFHSLKSLWYFINDLFVKKCLYTWIHISCLHIRTYQNIFIEMFMYVHTNMYMQHIHTCMSVVCLYCV